jgi:hypothetical protein
MICKLVVHFGLDMNEIFQIPVGHPGDKSKSFAFAYGLHTAPLVID